MNVIHLNHINMATSTMNGETKTGSSTASAQTAFVEAQVRLGYSMADVQMWQTLCRKLCFSDEESCNAMLVLLDIAHTHGVSPVSLASIIRATGKKSIDLASATMLLDYYPPGESGDEGEQEDEDETESESMSKRQRARKFVEDEADEE